MAQPRRQIIALIQRYVTALKARGIPVERVILFDSPASGQTCASSDIDLAVISPRFESLSPLERYEQLGLANRNLQAPLDVVGFSPAQVGHCEPGTMLDEILKTGVDVPPPARASASTRRKEYVRDR